ncbi:uncharacterized protein TNCV_4367381 [Trichonephila clavipes]|nr:uncharacterized protein TNCV_4367381 [Trichonephila clavipes]
MTGKEYQQKIEEHENSIIHIQACRTYDIWKQNKTVDSLLKCSFKEVNKVSQILRRIIDVTMTLAMYNLPFRGHRENRDSTQRGHFLNIIDLLAKYDPLLKVHLSEKEFKNILAPKIRNKRIAIIGSRIKENIIKNIRKPFFLYYSGHNTGFFKKDQLSIIIRYITTDVNDNNEPDNIRIQTKRS